MLTDFPFPDNQIDVIPIEGAPYNLIVAYDESADTWRWELRTLSGEVLFSGEHRLWSDAMCDGVHTAVELLPYEDNGWHGLEGAAS